MSQYHFIAGLPRSGSTLLSAILRQNPAINAGITSPAATILAQTQKAVSVTNEASYFLTEAQKAHLLRHAITGCHAQDGIVFDTNRGWPCFLPLLATLFPECRVICCVRDIGWIIDSFERLRRRNSFEISALYGSGNTVQERAQSLISATGPIGFAMNALSEGLYGEHADRMLLVEYETLARRPEETIHAVYDWCRIKHYDQHDFSAIEPIPGVEEFDRRGGAPGLHAVSARVTWTPRETILPPEIFNSFGKPIWRIGRSRAQVI